MCLKNIQNKLSQYSLDKKTYLALFITIITSFIFIIVMIYGKMPIAWDIFWGSDIPRVFLDFTVRDSYHSRVKVHPFYVLFWQTLYKIFYPYQSESSFPLRIMIAVFAGINSGLFSLIVSRFFNNKCIIVLLAAVFTISFPQLSQGSQIIESFIFTQTSLLVMMLYFLKKLETKEYELKSLLIIALFVIGNNLAYFVFFAIFYLYLLNKIYSSAKQALKASLKFSSYFLIFFQILLFLQSLIYGKSAPSGFISLYRSIVSEEGRYIQMNYSFESLILYAQSFFNLSLFYNLPVIHTSLVEWTWVWCSFLFLLLLFWGKIKNKTYTLALFSSFLFLFILHFLYGRNELFLYSPVIVCLLMSLFAVSLTTIPEKLAIFVTTIFFIFLLYVNSYGVYNSNRIGDYISKDKSSIEPPEVSKDKAKKILDIYRKNYDVNLFYFYKLLDK